MIAQVVGKLFNLPWRFIEFFNTLTMAKRSSKKQEEIVEGTMVICEPDYYVAFYDHRSDMIANGNSEKEVLRNLKHMYISFLKAEAAGEIETPKDNTPLVLPQDWNIKKFTDRVPRF